MTPANLQDPTTTEVSQFPTETVRTRSVFASNTLFGGVPSAVLEKICQQVEVVSVPTNKVVFDENEAGDCLYLIASGAIKISKGARDGRQETLAVLGPNDYFGEMALVDNEKRSAQASALEETVLGRIDRETWDLLLRFAPHEVMANFTRSMMQRLRKNNRRFIEEIGATTSAFASALSSPVS
jgi:CRP-like cAMP-binding protein